MSPAVADDVCVACTEPARTYRCRVAEAEGRPAFKGAGKLAQVVCIAELAKRGGHAACSVRRDGLSSCLGDVAVVDASALAAIAAPAAGPAQPPVDGADVATAAPTKPKTDAPPATVVELAKRTGEASKRQFETAGETVGGAMKKTWRCISSLFSGC